MSQSTAPTAAPPQQPTDRQILQRLALILAAGLPPALLARRIAQALSPLGIGSQASLAAVALLLRSGPVSPVKPLAGAGPVETAAGQARAAYQAAFTLNTAKRLQGVDLSDPKAAEAARANEARYLAAHRQAEQNRLSTARVVDRAAAQHGPVLGWKAVLDARTSPLCRWMDGKNFKAADPPLGVLPGSVHGACRCKPVGPHPGAEVVGSSAVMRVAKAEGHDTTPLPKITV